MADLIERLTKRADLHGAGPDYQLLRAARDEIERLLTVVADYDPRRKPGDAIATAQFYAAELEAEVKRLRAQHTAAAGTSVHNG